MLADIGDQQSIEQSLSTFSAHIASIQEMVADATPDSLVLLDELGRRRIRKKAARWALRYWSISGAGAMALASTHLLALKVYGANTASVSERVDGL